MMCEVEFEFYKLQSLQLLQSFMIKFLYNKSDIIFLTARSYQFYNFLEIYNFIYAHYKF